MVSLKVGLLTSKKVFFICFNESTLKVMKNAHIKSSFRTQKKKSRKKEKKNLMRKLRLNLKFMTSQTGQQIIAIHIMLNISRTEGI